MTARPVHPYGPAVDGKTLYVTPPIGDPPQGGRAMLSALHLRCLRDILGDELAVHEVQPRRGRALAALTGRIDGAAKEAERALLERIEREDVVRIILNGSNLGRLAATVRKHRRDVAILTMFHNVEARFFAGAFGHRPTPRSLGVLIANYRAERMAVRSSDRRIALNWRDGALLERLYGKAATEIVPMALADQRTGTPAASMTEKPYLLFVGGGFYANRDGIRWFAREVAPHSAIPTIVVGRGLEDLREELERGGQLRLIGEADDLEPWYQGAAAVIAPIFDGSGMKTKVAEALMFGKSVFGTPEAFAGYEDVVEEAGTLCRDASEFIAAVRALPIDATDNAKLRLLYERYYSFEAARDRFAAILASASTRPV